MREDGTWGGNQELYAAARLFQVYVVIHQENSRMVIECDALRPTRVVHVAYHGSDHYDSIRSLQDPCENNTVEEIVLDCDGFRPDDLAKVRSVYVTPNSVSVEWDGSPDSVTSHARSAGKDAKRQRVRSLTQKSRRPPASHL